MKNKKFKRKKIFLRINIESGHLVSKKFLIVLLQDGKKTMLMKHKTKKTIGILNEIVSSETIP